MVYTAFDEEENSEKLADDVDKNLLEQAKESKRGRRILSIIQSTLGGKLTLHHRRSFCEKKLVHSSLTSVEEMLEKLKLATDEVEVTSQDISASF